MPCAARTLRRMRKAFPICTSTVFTEIPSRLAISAYLRPSNRLSSKIWRTSISSSWNGARLSHSIASSFDSTRQIQ